MDAPEGPVECARRQLAEQEERDRAGVEDLSLPPPDDFRFPAEHARKMARLREAIVVAEAEEQQRQRDAAQARADEVVTRRVETGQHSHPVDATPAKSSAQKFYELMATRLGEMAGRCERDLRNRVDGYLLARSAEADALRQRVEALEAKVAKLERRK